MNKSILSKFTPEVLAGAGCAGVDIEAVARLLHITADKYGYLASGLSSLTPSQACLPERETGRSIGELAILGIDSRSPKTTAYERQLVRDTIELMAAFDDVRANAAAPAAPAKSA